MGSRKAVNAQDDMCVAFSSAAQHDSPALSPRAREGAPSAGGEGVFRRVRRYVRVIK